MGMAFVGARRHMQGERDEQRKRTQQKHHDLLRAALDRRRNGDCAPMPRDVKSARLTAAALPPSRAALAIPRTPRIPRRRLLAQPPGAAY